MKRYEDFEKEMSEEVKKESEEFFNKIFEPYKDDELLLLVSTDPNDITYVRKVKINN